jgi:hypothetical protein
MRLWLPDNPVLDDLGDLPDEVEINLIPPRGAPPDAFADAEFLVPPYMSRRVLEQLPLG